MRFSSSHRVNVFTLCGYWLFAIATCVALATAANAAETHPAGDIVAVAVRGDVRVTMGEVTTPLYANAIIQLPATIRSAADGSFELRQGPTTIAAAGNTELEIPVSALADGLIERVVQVTGNAFYSVGKRERTKLRVETPFLVAVIKGTQFNVASQQDSTTIALFEGRLEVRATDESDVVDLHAGEIAIRNRNDVSIGVLRMNATASNAAPRVENLSAVAASNNGAAIPDAGGAVSQAPQSAGPSSQSSSPLASVAADTGDAAIVNTVAASSNIGHGADSVAESAASLVAKTEAAAGVGASIGSAGVGVDAHATTAVDLASGAVSAGVGAAATVANVNANLGVSASTSQATGGLAAGTGTSIAAGNASVAADTHAAVDLSSVSVTANAHAGVSLGNGGSASAANSSVAVTPSSVSAGVGATVGAGNAVAADLGVNASATPSNVTVTTGANAGVAGVAAGANVAASVGPGAGTSVAVSVEPAAVAPALSVTAGVSGASGASAGVSVGNVVSVGAGTGSTPVNVNVGGNDTGGGLLRGLLNRTNK